MSKFSLPESDDARQYPRAVLDAQGECWIHYGDLTDYLRWFSERLTNIEGLDPLETAVALGTSNIITYLANEFEVSLFRARLERDDLLDPPGSNDPRSNP